MAESTNGLIIIDHSKRKHVEVEPWEAQVLALFKNRKVLQEPPQETVKVIPQEAKEPGIRPEVFGAVALLVSGGGVALALAGALIPAAGCAALAIAALIGFVAAM